MAELNIPPAPTVEGARHLHSGKVRDLYELPGGDLLMVASDRISIFDFVLDSTIPDKGELLTRMSLWWFERLADVLPNHVVSTDVPEQVRGAREAAARRQRVPLAVLRVRVVVVGQVLDHRRDAVLGK